MKWTDKAGLVWELQALPEDQDPDYELEDGSLDTEVIEELLRDLEGGNEWAWCCACLSVTFEEWTGDSYLGGCSYKDEADFVRDGYFGDMAQEALTDLKWHIKCAKESMAIWDEIEHPPDDYVPVPPGTATETKHG